MAAITLRCSHCHKRLKVGTSLRGRNRLSCPVCSRPFYPVAVPVQPPLAWNSRPLAEAKPRGVRVGAPLLVALTAGVLLAGILGTGIYGALQPSRASAAVPLAPAAPAEAACAPQAAP